MAAEVPVSDILCEAMEYLSKLGSNLQTRSKNLTERRIRKDKLKNSHAVQKAANKVLLICELSKKSLDNVENGVRKVMSLLEASQAPSNIGGNTSNAKSSNNKHKYHYFEYESRKLRVAKKIPLKHYMSVKVIAKGMPASMQEKYPVYYDCKLKRLRKKTAERHTSEKKRKNSESLSDNEQQSYGFENKCKSAEDIPSDLDQNSVLAIEENNDSEIVSKCHITDNEALTSDNHCENKEQNTGLNSPKCDGEEHSDHNIMLDKEKMLEAASEEDTHGEIHTKSNKHNKKKKKGRVKFVDVYSDSDNETHKNECKKSEPMEINLCSDEEDKPDSSPNEPKAKKLKLAESDEATNNQLDCNDLETAGEVDNSNKDLQSDNNSTGTKSQEDSQNDSGAESKPLIRCVNLNKLLKPDILSKKKDVTNVNNNSESLKNSKLSIKDYFRVSNKNEKGSKDNDAKKRQKESDDEYWEQKRKEVSNFKAQKFFINVERLPNLNENFLLAHNLKNITKKGNVICEVLKEIDTPKKVDAVKCALLNDSDSDTCKEKPETNKVKESHLKDSNSECVHSIKKHSKKSKCNVNKNQKEKSDTDSIKNTLLIDSDSEKSDVEGENDKQMELENTSNNQQNEHDASYESHGNNSPSEECDIQSDQIDPETHSKINKKSKSALLDDDSSDEKSDTNDEDTPNKNSDQVKSFLLNSTSDEETPTKTNNKVKSLSQDASDEKSDTNGEKTPTKTNNKTALSLLNSPPDEDFAGFSKEDQVTPTKTIEKVKSAFLNNSSDEKQGNSDKDTPTKTNKKTKSALLNNSSDEKQDNSEKETPTKTNKKTKYALLNNSSDEMQDTSEKETPTKTNENMKSCLLNDSSDEMQDTSEKETPTKTNKKIKSALLNDSSDEMQDTSEKETPTKTNKKIKSALLNDSSDEMQDTSEKETPTKTNKKKTALLNDSSDEKQDNNEKETSTKTNKKIKSALLNNSSDEMQDTSEKETSTKTNENMKSCLLNYSSDEKQDTSQKVSGESEKQKKTEENTATKTNATIKSVLLNDSSEDKSGQNDNDSHNNMNKSEKNDQESSDVKSDTSDDNIEKRKTPKSKRKYARKSREARKKLKYSSSSESEQEIHRVKQARKKSQMSGSSSASEHITKKSKMRDFSSNSNNSDNGVSRTIDQVDGADEHSNSSDKMVRSKAKPSGSSSQNSDNQDATDKDIDRLTNLNNLSKNRRGDSTKSREDTDSKKRSRRSKATPTIGEDLLKAESSSDASDDGENEFEELPSVTLPGLNGDSIGRIAQEDLLGESDSSVSHHDKDQSENTENMDETDGEQKLKLKRRKAANAISSDSDGGSHRRKEAKEERMSDFEESEDESSESTKKAKRKKIVSDSDGSVDSNDGKKKRRRIKQVNESDASGSDTENEGRNKHGRKNIRKVMGKNQLEEATKKAAREEKERVARIMERQKLYNNLDFDESGKPDEVVLEKVILDFDPETKEPSIQVDRGLVKKLKPHQANGIKFMWDACFESVKRIKKDKGSGCILAHCMGLGKTLQVISLTHTLLTHNTLTGVNRVLVVCPLSTVLNWVNEFKMWLKHAEAEFEVDVYELSRYKQNSERAFQLQQWLDGGGVCVLGYEMFRNLSADNPKKFKKKMLRSFQDSLVDPGPDLVVCDEGHLLKNEKTSLSQSMNRVKTLRRIVLTGTPLQNNLKEYYCMVQFVKPNLLGKYNEYLNRFVNPITNGQYTDSTEHDIRVMKRRSHVLHKMLDGAVQRRDYGVLAPFLPPKHEYVLFITLSDVQIKLYQFYLENYSRRPLPGKSSGFLFPDFQSLQRIWTHPLVLKYNSERYEIMQQKKREREEEDSEGSLVDFIDDDSTPDESTTDESTDDSSDMSDDSRKKSKKKKSAKKGKGKDSKVSTRRGTRANPIDVDDVDQQANDIIEVKNENPTEWWIKLVEESEIDDMRNSHKLVLLFDILRQCETIGDKLLVFSQSLYSLDLIEHFLGKVDEATQEGRIDEKLGGHVGSWSPGVDYFRLDGSTSCENRSIWCKNFNREDNPRARLFLISTRAGGLGINLVAANRVVIFDVSWNPSHDVQSIFRVYRFGQKKPCYIYRFLAMGTMEEKIYERQVTKQAISKRVIDEQQIDRHYAENDLAELYKFEARPNEPRPLPTLPKDRLFAEMLREHEPQIYKYHEHDSLLENKEEETLSEEERKAAWEDFENEKNKPPPTVMQAWPMHNGMVPGLLAQQQQQLAYAALAAMLRKDMPNINDNQIRDMLPLIYNSNPGLMQKMSEIYKYAQPGMMNPAMMNPVMNAASGGGAMGGTSGLQYEPPWQRQQQQQQQMRLQQLMQQQNQMGAKFYAGGLGSRDPVAMALQQQRAREIMAGGGARPRGRPPLLPRLPSAAAADVVNLDSD